MNCVATGYRGRRERGLAACVGSERAMCCHDGRVTWRGHHGDTGSWQVAITRVCHPIRRIYGPGVEMILGAPQGTDLKRLEFNPGNQYPNKTRHLGHKTWPGKKCEHFIWAQSVDSTAPDLDHLVSSIPRRDSSVKWARVNIWFIAAYKSAITSQEADLGKHSFTAWPVFVVTLC